jgi:hypothetical protein
MCYTDRESPLSLLTAQSRRDLFCWKNIGLSGFNVRCEPEEMLRILVTERLNTLVSLTESGKLQYKLTSVMLIL